MRRSIVGIETHLKMDFCDTQERQFFYELVHELAKNSQEYNKKKARRSAAQAQTVTIL